MADLLTNIQSDVRHYADDSNLVITSGQGLRVGNLIYQGMCTEDFMLLGMKIGRRWPEATREDETTVMVVGQEQYTWLATPDFKDPIWLEGLDSNASDEPYPILWAPDMTTWSFYDQTGNAEPEYARLVDVAGVVKIALRPKPTRTDKLRITGMIEVTEFTATTAIDGTTKTIFKNVSSDRALSLFISADYKAKRGDRSRAEELLMQGLGLLPKQDVTPSLTGTGRIRPWNYGRTARMI